MISEKIQRTMMGAFLLVVLYLINAQELVLATYLLGAIITLVFIWAIFDFCPSLWTLKKLFKEECAKC